MIPPAEVIESGLTSTLKKTPNYAAAKENAAYCHITRQ